jgi:hypothetical protein
LKVVHIATPRLTQVNTQPLLSDLTGRFHFFGERRDAAFGKHVVQ